MKLHTAFLYPRIYCYHPHLGEVNQALLSEVGSSFLNESQVSEVHAQVWHTWWVAAIKHVQIFIYRFTHVSLCFPLRISRIYFFSVSLRFLNLPSDDTVFCNLSISAFVLKTHKITIAKLYKKLCGWIK